MPSEILSRFAACKFAAAHAVLFGVVMGVSRIACLVFQSLILLGYALDVLLLLLVVLPNGVKLIPRVFDNRRSAEIESAVRAEPSCTNASDS